MPPSLPLTPHQGALRLWSLMLCSAGARKEISRKAIHLINKCREGKREKTSPKQNIQKGQEVKQQCESIT